MEFQIVLLALTAVATAAALRTRFNEEWETYITKHGKKYQNDTEEHRRQEIWYSNLKKIQHHNTRHSMRKTNQEFVKLTSGHKRYKSCDCCDTCQPLNTLSEFLNVTSEVQGCSCCSHCKNSRLQFVSPLGLQVPAFVDWRKNGYVTSVKSQAKNQNHCGSCWAFSATGSLEGQIARKTGLLISLSEQNLIDCSQDEGNDGCTGGQVDQAFQYIKKNGIETEAAYPYTAEYDYYCRSNSENTLAKGIGFVDIPSGDEKALIAAIATIGPISVRIYASHESFQYYAGGVYNEPNCSSTETKLNHYALAVGYGTDPVAGDYYIIKNSWGEYWGLRGYILMSRNQDNQCGIATAASYPIV